MAQKIYTSMELYAPITKDADVVNKKYVDGVVSRKIKEPVRVASGSNLDFTYNTTDKTLTQNTPDALVIDTVTIAEGDRVLVAGQTDNTQNGIYVVTTLGVAETSTGAGDGVAAVLTRADDFNSNTDIMPNVIIPVMEGKDSGDTNYQLINDSAVTLDSDSIMFAKFKGAEGAITYSSSFTTDGTTTEWVITHGLDSKNIKVSIYDHATNEECVFGVALTSTNTVTISSSIALDAGQTFDVVIIG